ncbi:MAG: FAD:protein FMN transferase [Pseudomonadota bacterium]
MVDPTIISRRSLFFVPLALAACKDRTNIVELVGSTMGTTYSVVAVDRTGTLSRSSLQSAVDTALADVNASMSNWDAASEISRLNAARSSDPISISPALSNVLTAAADVHSLSDGQFDVSTGPLIDLWGFGAKKGAMGIPTEQEVQSALALSGQGRVIALADGTVTKLNPSVELYLSAIGKGYGVDAIGHALAALGVEDFMVEIGGDLLTAGVNPDGAPWQIGIETPSALAGVQQVVGVTGMGLATSGDYRNYFERDGVRYSHILDAKTGRPISHRTASATVVTENAMLADAWATAMLILGSETGLELADALDMPALFIDREGDGFKASASSAFETLTA